MIRGYHAMQLTFLETLGLKNAWLRRLVALVVLVYPAFDFVQFVARIPTNRLIDLFVQVTAARVLVAHGDIYSFSTLRQMADQVGGVRYGSAFSNLLLAYTHPPSDTFLDVRWTFFSWPDAKVLYAGISFLLFLTTLILLWTTLRASAPRALHWVWPALLFALYGPARSSLGLGQQDIVIFFLIVLSFWATTREHDLAAGIALAIATLMKITPGVFVLYFLWKREWRLALYTMGAGVVIVLLSLPLVGIDRYFQFATQIFPAISTGTSYFDNQSLPGLINRLLLDPVYSQGLQSAPSIPLLRVLLTATELGLVGLALVFSRGQRIHRRSLGYALEFSFWLLIQPILSPIAWDHYFTWLLLPITVVLATLLNSRQTIQRTGFVLLALAISVGLTSVSTQVFQRWPEPWQQSPLLYGALILLVLLCERIRWDRRALAVPSPVVDAVQPALA